MRCIRGLSLAKAGRHAVGQFCEVGCNTENNCFSVTHVENNQDILDRDIQISYQINNGLKHDLSQKQAAGICKILKQTPP